MKPIHYRQGDVLIVSRARKPKGEMKPIDRDERGRLILAAGEATGHHHAIAGMNAGLFEAQEPGKCFLFIEGDAVTLSHEEHGGITIAPGWYEVIRQREYSPEAIRNIAD